ncbi:hypothetical protein SELMODRAFT_447240 [Selaginella moellendorffii]|uniref:Chalcone-flavonone isomerase family protein n=1 Tax=Selaginella moellendorffii TaxID=88036 RepID=D8SXX8_SELML|nr:hypothetical protein SELMODRAFT_447240 [Selaginella moellendorffii]
MEMDPTFAQSIQSPSSSETLILLGHGITDMTIETIHVIFTKIGVYFAPQVKDHLQSFKCLPVSELLKDGSAFFQQLIQAPVSKLIKILLVKGQLGSQYASTIETSVRDRLAYDDKYEEDEEIALANLCEFFQSKKLEPNSTIVYSWPSSSSHVEARSQKFLSGKIFFQINEGSKAPSSFIVNNENVSTSIIEWILGENSMTPSTVESVAKSIATEC